MTTTIDGLWKFTAQTPGGERTFLVRLATEGERVIGMVSSDDGEHDVVDGRVAGDDFSWVVRKAVMGMDLRFQVVVTDGEVSGVVKVGMLGKMPVRGVRAEAAA